MRLAHLAGIFLFAISANAGDYYKHVIFDNSATADNYYFSTGFVHAPAELTLNDGKLPVERKTFRTPPNALRLEWKSAPGGSWEALVTMERWRNHPVFLEGDVLRFWLYAPQAMAPKNLPRLQLSDIDGGFSAPVKLDGLVREIPAARWFQVSVSLRLFHTLSFRPFNPLAIQSLHFMQGAPDDSSRTLIIDEIRIDSSAQTAASPATPANLTATGSDSHIDLKWSPAPGAERYVIYRSFDGSQFDPIGIETGVFHRYTDFLGKHDQKAFYKVKASNTAYRESAFSNQASATTHALTDDQLLTMLQEACFRFYWDDAHPVSGTTLENLPGDENMVATGASGFGILALIAGTERGFITRDQLAERMRKILTFLEKADRFHGVWPHFLDGRTGKTLPVFGKYDNGGDLVETAFLVEGVLAARQYLKSDEGIYRRITALWETVEWDWHRRTPDGTFLYWHWSPDYTWQINNHLTGWNETMIVYLLAIASPTHSVPASLYYTGWASHGYPGPGGFNGPLFFAHYSYLGFDPHSLTDKYANYYDVVSGMALRNLAYCIDNPHHYPGYSEQLWGLTASDEPSGYRAHEPTFREDTGTMTPTGALASYVYTPKASMDALKYFYFHLGDKLWGPDGPRDAFNLKDNWYAQIYMGLNQAPITVMIENQRSGLLWKLFMANPEMQPTVNKIQAER